MAGSDLGTLKSSLGAVLLLAPLVGACAHGGDGTQKRAPQPEPTAATAPVTPPMAPPKNERPRPSPPPPAETPPILVEIEAGPPSELQDHKTLVEASRLARERRLEDAVNHRQRKPIAVINNDNLGELAKAGELTYAEEQEPAPDLTSPSDPEGSGVEEYWRDRSSGLRDEWRRVVEERQDVEARAALLRRRFYAEDDPFVRDGQVKPEWDQALERLAELRRAEETLRIELDELYAEGALAGAEPHWLEGSEDWLTAEEETVDHESVEAVQELEAHEVQNPPN